MSDTPRVDELVEHLLNANRGDKVGVYARNKAIGMESLARALERELIAKNKRIAELEQVSAPGGKV
jgi:hypothetical protein